MITPFIPADLGIIGGADGPTAIFVTGPDINWPIVAGIAAAVVVAVIVAAAVRHKRNGK